MQRYGVSDLKQQFCTVQNINYILKKYPDLLTSLNTKKYSSKLKCEGRVLRRDTERIKKIKRSKKQPNYLLKQFESAFFEAMENETALFHCPICRTVLRGPVTVECGHSFCAACIENCEKCTVCDMDLTGQAFSVNVLVQDLVEKWRERNKCAENLGVPATADILGVEPRYHLRSGYAGLQINNDIEEKLMNFLYDRSEENFPRNKREKRVLEENFNARSNIRLSEACFLEKIKENREHFQLTLDNVFKEVDEIKESALKSSWKCIAISDLECILCSRCILDPVTTSCGHTFCRDCLTRVLDHKLACPLCMAALKVADYARKGTQVLDRAIRFLAPREFEERLKGRAKESLSLERCSDIPVFVCTNAFPGVACPLKVYEPRYRLLARRCLQSPTKRFAMAGKGSNGDRFMQYGTILEVKDAVSLEDGRFILTTVGMRRYKVLSRGEQDGYDTAKVQYIKDVQVPPEKLPELIAIHQKVHNKASKWIKSLTPKILTEVERLIGRMPKVEKNWPGLPDGPSWTWWLMPILPLSSKLQVGFLSTTSLEKRLRVIDKMLDFMKIKMRGLQRNTVNCSQDEDTSDSCADTRRTFEMPFTES